MTTFPSHHGNKSQTVTYYRRFRATGLAASHALSCARTLARFRRLEDLGYVRLSAVFDEHFDSSWMDKRQRDEWDGEAWGLVSECRLPMPDGFEYDDDEAGWQSGGSVWGHVGYRDVLDPFENCYVPDVMAEALAGYDNAVACLAEAIESHHA